MQTPGATKFDSPAKISIALLTGGKDWPYTSGLINSLLSAPMTWDLIGGDEHDRLEFRNQPAVNFLNLRGGTSPGADTQTKYIRMLKYYVKLIGYAATTKSKLFHILWNNRIEAFDRTLLMLYYRMLGKKIVFTAHNVNKGQRDNTDSYINRLTLRIQYRLAHHLFVHTEKNKRELIEQFGVRDDRITAIPLGINNAMPRTSQTPNEARQKLGLLKEEKVLLFFGRISPYKGLDYLISAFRQLQMRDGSYRLLVAGGPDGFKEYWSSLQSQIKNDPLLSKVLVRPELIPDSEVEWYFKAADALVLPYRDISQSGVLFLGQSFGLPVLAADVGSFKEDVFDGENGFLFKANEPADIVRVIEQYFASPLYQNLDRLREKIRSSAEDRHSWERVGQIVSGVYFRLLKTSIATIPFEQDSRAISTDVNADRG